MNHINNIYQNDKTILREALPMELPLCISIEPTNLCNFKCIMCSHGSSENYELAKPLCNMTQEIFEKTIADIKAWSAELGGKKVKLIKLYSLGEPLIHPDICNMVKIIKEADVCEKIEITTNASLLTHEVADKLVAYGLDVCRISIYSVDDEQNERITQSKVSTDLIRGNVEYLYNARKDDKKPFIVAKMFDAGEDENMRFEKEYKDISDLVAIDELFQNVMDSNDTQELYYGKSEGEKRKSAESVSKRKRKLCRYPFTHITVRNDGSVVVCCNDWIKELCIGNVMDASLKDIWNSKTLFDLRADMITHRGENRRICHSCEIPYRDAPEDNIDDITIDRFSYMGR